MVSSRLYRWRAASVIASVLKRLQASANVRGATDWDLHFMDATVIRAHQHGAVAYRSSKPIAAVLTGGERHDQPALLALLRRRTSDPDSRPDRPDAVHHLDTYVD